MDKRKLQALYVVLGLIGFLLFNYPVLNLSIGKWINGIPAVLVYTAIAVLLISIAGYFIARQNEE